MKDVITIMRVLGGGIILTTGAALTTTLCLDWAELGETALNLLGCAALYGVLTIVVWWAYDKLLREWNQD